MRARPQPGRKAADARVTTGDRQLTAEPPAVRQALEKRSLKENPDMIKLAPALATLVSALMAVGSTGVAQADSPGHGGAGGNEAGRGFQGAAIVVAWNRELLHIVQIPGAQPATIHQTRSYALLQAAIYDAIVSITGNGRPYLLALEAPSGARPDAAAAAAGHATLTALYPTMKAALDQLLANELALIPDGRPKAQGVEVGAQVATLLLAARANDGSGALPAPFAAGSQPGDYRSTPPNFPSPVFSTWGSVMPFLLQNGAQFRPAPPPALTSASYARALNEVESLGRASSTTRTSDQTLIGKFWAPPIWNTWNAIAEDAALAHHTNLERTAAMFAALDLSFADTAIAMYDAKYHYQLWRPITAIRLADTDGNSATIGDPTWTPLAVTAADPSYPGAHSSISGAGAAVLSAFFSNRDEIQVTSPAMPGAVRAFESYADVATEAGLSRIFAGQHTRIDHETGLKLGRDVAQFVLIESGLGRSGLNDMVVDTDS
jgi:membrane-associated phospholipid phosphatase